MHIYRNSSTYQAEISRCLFKLSQIKRDAGNALGAASDLEEATRLYAKFSKPSGRQPATEADFDALVVFWSR